MHCDRHPQAFPHGGHCPACLLEGALAADDMTADNRTVASPGNRDAETRRLTIQLPLGASASACVFLVREEGVAGRLLRLKIWRTPAPTDFLARFRELRTRLDHWRHGRIALPLAACLDATGCPLVLSDFRQGIPIVDGVRSGTLDPEHALAVLRSLLEVARSAHAHGLAHGSIVPGNVIVQPRSGSVHLVDFGLTAVLAPLTDQAALTSADRNGIAALARTVRGFRRLPSSPERPL